MRHLRDLSLAAILLWAAAAAAAPGGNVYLAQAKVFYQGLEFEKCLQRLEQAGRMEENSREELAEIELYTGLCRFNLGKRDDAETNFKLALQLDPDLTLPPATSPRIAAVFDPLAAQVKKNRPQEQVAHAPASTVSPGPVDAPKKVELAPAPKSERAALAATAPEARGPKILPLALGGTSVVAAGLATTFGLLARSHEAQANDPATWYADAQQLGNDARNEALIANVCVGVATAAAVGAVVTWIASED